MLHLTIAAASSAALAPAAAAAEPAPDAELIALGRDFDAALARFHQASDTYEALDDLFEAQELPPWPTAATVRRWDHVLLRGRLNPFRYAIGDEYSEEDVETLREWERPHRPKFHWVRNAEGKREERYLGHRPWPRAIRRLEEIVAAVDARAAEIDRGRDELGAAAASTAFDEADDAMWGIIASVTAMQAFSPAGLTVKARVLAYLSERFGRIGGDDPERRLTASLLADIARAGGDDPERPAPAGAMAADQASPQLGDVAA